MTNNFHTLHSSLVTQRTHSLEVS